jgi:probable HAF family extracellular repeat protein
MRAFDQSVVQLCAAAFATCAAGSACFGGDIRYDIRFLLPPPGGPVAYRPSAINNSGAIAGGNPIYDVDSPAVRWDPGATVATRLTGLGGVNSLGKTQDAAWGINDSGAIVGWGLTADGQAMHALRWDPGATVATDIGGGGFNSQAYKINSTGAIVGEGSLTNSIVDRRPVYWPPGATTFTVLPVGGYSSADCHVRGINDAGILAGEVQGYAGPAAVTWSPPYKDLTYLPDLPGSPVTSSTDINASGAVVGYVERDSGLTYHGFRYDPMTETMSELLGRPGIDPEHGNPGTLSIFALAVNADGVAVGKAGFLYQEHAVVWLPGSTDAVDLNSLIDPAAGWVLKDAWDINNAGQIIGRATSASGSGGYYVLTPVPEPAILGPSLVALAAARQPPRRRRK